MHGKKEKSLPQTVKVNLCICSKCDTSFYPKIDNETGKVIKPKYCIQCRSPNWNKPKKHYFVKKQPIKPEIVEEDEIFVKPTKISILERFREAKTREELKNAGIKGIPIKVK